MQTNHDQAIIQPRRSFWTTFLIGVGIMAAVDEIVFHQLLSWHHFYDQATPAISLMSDGLLHAAELIALVAGFFMLADLRHRHAFSVKYAQAGFFLGLGCFQVFDGLVDHKVLRLHQIRYGVDLLPYDLVWNLVGFILILIGVGLLSRARKFTAIKATDQNH
ncbi:putative membrane protein [Catalinimonas alkaloidigena]|uniref:DUF2243 domain-containing protein n=1 Tax=Catalinimonas alkaloidigena TaxID=1075417 RepID=UPI00240663B2|nr:DUF2243 domain-containing protein [Catalinimonas alkaloidigena]MDF9797086.1 putative membrane protein [Catalinimonas alkaloidigena]